MSHLLVLLACLAGLAGCGQGRDHRLPRLEHECAPYLSLRGGFQLDGRTISGVVDCATRKDSTGGGPAVAGLVNELGEEGIDQVLAFLKQPSPFPGDEAFQPYLGMLPVLMERGLFGADGLRLTNVSATARLDLLQEFLRSASPFRLGQLVMSWHEKGDLDRALDHLVGTLDVAPDGALTALFRSVMEDDEMRQDFTRMIQETLNHPELYPALKEFVTLRSGRFLPTKGRDVCVDGWQDPVLRGSGRRLPVSGACLAAASPEGLPAMDGADRLDELLADPVVRQAIIQTGRDLGAFLLGEMADENTWLWERLVDGFHQAMNQSGEPLKNLAWLMQQMVSADGGRLRGASVLRKLVLDPHGLIQTVLTVPANLSVLRRKAGMTRMQYFLSDRILHGLPADDPCGPLPGLLDHGTLRADPLVFLQEFMAGRCLGHPRLTTLILTELQRHCLELGRKDCRGPEDYPAGAGDKLLLQAQDPELTAFLPAPDEGAARLLNRLVHMVMAETAVALEADPWHLWTRNLATGQVSAELFRPRGLLPEMVEAARPLTPASLARLDQQIDEHSELRGLFQKDLLEHLLEARIRDLAAQGEEFSRLLPVIGPDGSRRPVDERRILKVFTGMYTRGPVATWTSQSIRPDALETDDRILPPHHLSALASTLTDSQVLFDVNREFKFKVPGSLEGVLLQKSSGQPRAVLHGAGFFRTDHLFDLSMENGSSNFRDVLGQGQIRYWLKDAPGGREQEVLDWYENTALPGWFEPESPTRLALRLEGSREPLRRIPGADFYITTPWKPSEIRLLAFFYLQNFMQAPWLAGRDGSILGHPVVEGAWVNPRRVTEPSLQMLGPALMDPTQSFNTWAHAWSQVDRMQGKDTARNWAGSLLPEAAADFQAGMRHSRVGLDKAGPVWAFFAGFNLMTWADRRNRTIQPIYSYGDALCAAGPCPWQFTDLDYQGFREVMAALPLSRLCRLQDLGLSPEMLGLTGPVDCGFMPDIADALSGEGQGPRLPDWLIRQVLQDLHRLGKNPVLRAELRTLVPAIRLEKLRIEGHETSAAALGNWIRRAFIVDGPSALYAGYLQAKYRPFIRTRPGGLEVLLQSMVQGDGPLDLGSAVMDYGDTRLIMRNGVEEPSPVIWQLFDLASRHVSRAAGEEEGGDEESLLLPVLRLISDITRPGNEHLLEAATALLVDLDSIGGGQAFATLGALGDVFYWQVPENPDKAGGSLQPEPGYQMLKQLIRTENFRALIGLTRNFRPDEIRETLLFMGKQLRHFGETPVQQEEHLEPLVRFVTASWFSVGPEGLSLTAVSRLLDTFYQGAFAQDYTSGLRRLLLKITGHSLYSWQDLAGRQVPPLMDFHDGKTPPLFVHSITQLHRMVRDYQIHQLPPSARENDYFRSMVLDLLRPLPEDKSGAAEFLAFVSDPRLGLSGAWPYWEAPLRCGAPGTQACGGSGRRHLLKGLLTALSRPDLRSWHQATTGLRTVLPDMAAFLDLTRRLRFREGVAGARVWRNNLDSLIRLSAPPEENPMLSRQLDLIETWLTRPDPGEIQHVSALGAFHP